jgi:hypothetical protein
LQESPIFHRKNPMFPGRFSLKPIQWNRDLPRNVLDLVNQWILVTLDSRDSQIAAWPATVCQVWRCKLKSAGYVWTSAYWSELLATGLIAIWVWVNTY